MSRTICSLPDRSAGLAIESWRLGLLPLGDMTRFDRNKALDSTGITGQISGSGL